jgi:hypothetical protein
MTVIPKERSGMASGISGTVRFTGLVVGIAALGAVLYSRVTLAVAEALPKVSSADRATLVHDITAGSLSGATLAGHDASSFRALATVSFASGYHALFLAGALFMLISTILTWRLVSPAETPPIPASSARPQSKPQ